MAELLLICAAIAGLGAVTAGITNCDPNFNVGQIGVIIRWTPVKNLTFSADVTYTMLDQKFEGVLNGRRPLLWPSRQLRTS